MSYFKIGTVVTEIAFGHNFPYAFHCSVKLSLSNSLMTLLGSTIVSSNYHGGERTSSFGGWFSTCLFHVRKQTGIVITNASLINNISFWGRGGGVPMVENGLAPLEGGSVREYVSLSNSLMTLLGSTIVSSNYHGGEWTSSFGGWFSTCLFHMRKQTGIVITNASLINNISFFFCFFFWGGGGGGVSHGGEWTSSFGGWFST